MRAPSFANLITLEGWIFFGEREGNEVVECDSCSDLAEEGWGNLQSDEWLCSNCYAIESGEK